MRAFDYVQPTTIDAAIKTLAERDTVCLAGGTNLLDLMKGNVEQPLRLVDISMLRSLRFSRTSKHQQLMVGRLSRADHSPLGWSKETSIWLGEIFPP